MNLSALFTIAPAPSTRSQVESWRRRTTTASNSISISNSIIISSSSSSSSSSPSESADDDPQAAFVQHHLYRFGAASVYAALLLTVFGLVGNVLSARILIYSRQHSPKIRSVTFLTSFALVNALYLLVHWYGASLDRTIHHLGLAAARSPATALTQPAASPWLVRLYAVDSSALVCKLVPYAHQFAANLHNLLIVTFSLERLCAAYAPVRHRSMRLSRPLLIAYVCAALLTPLHQLVYSELVAVGVASAANVSLPTATYEAVSGKALLLLYASPVQHLRAAPAPTLTLSDTPAARSTAGAAAGAAAVNTVCAIRSENVVVYERFQALSLLGLLVAYVVVSVSLPLIIVKMKKDQHILLSYKFRTTLVAVKRRRSDMSGLAGSFVGATTTPTRRRTTATTATTADHSTAHCRGAGAGAGAGAGGDTPAAAGAVVAALAANKKNRHSVIVRVESRRSGPRRSLRPSSQHSNDEHQLLPSTTPPAGANQQSQQPQQLQQQQHALMRTQKTFKYLSGHRSSKAANTATLTTGRRFVVNGKNHSTRMLIALSGSFMLFNLPYFVVMGVIVASCRTLAARTQEQLTDKLELVSYLHLAEILQLANFSITSLLFFISGRLFRFHFVNFLKCDVNSAGGGGGGGGGGNRINSPKEFCGDVAAGVGCTGIKSGHIRTALNGAI